MRFAKLSTLAVIAISLISTDTLASPMNRKFHPVVNDDPQNAHLNVQTPGADINQTITIKEEPGPDGQVIPAGDTKVAASCAVKDADGDIDLSGGSLCSSSPAPAPSAERPAIVVSPISRAASPSPRTVRVPSPASLARAGNMNASAPTHAVEAVRVPALLPAHRTEAARVSARPGKQLAPAVRAPAGRANVTLYAFVRTWWLEFGLAAAMLLALGLGLLFRMGLGGLLRLRRRDEPDTGEEHAARAERIASAVIHHPLPLP